MSDAVLHTAPGPSASRAAWAMPLIPVAVSGFLLSAMTSLRVQGDLPSPPEGSLAGGVVALYRLFGFEPLFMVCVLTLTWSSIWFLTGRVERPLSRLARIGALGLSLAILVNLRVDGVLPPGGGELGALLAARLASVISPAVSIFAVAVAAVAALLLATDFFFYGHFERLGARRISARTADAPAPEVDVGEQEELESLALPVARAAEPVVSADAVPPPAAERPIPATPSDGGEIARSPEAAPDAEAAVSDVADVAPSTESVGDSGPVDEGVAEVWAIEEELSAMTLLGPRSAPAVDEEEPVDAPEAASAPIASADAEDVDASFDAVDDEAPEAPLDDPELAEAAAVRASDGAGEPIHGPEVFAAELVEDTVSDEVVTAPIEEPVSSPQSLDPATEVASQQGDEEPQPEPAFEQPDEELDEELDDEPAAAVTDEPVVELIPAPRKAPRNAPTLDPDLVDEAAELVLTYRRASANFLKRRLRVEDGEAMALLQVLAERGIIDCEAGATQGRVRGG